MTGSSFFDEVEAALKERVFVPGQMTEKGELRFIQQVAVENRGADQGKHIFLSRKKPHDFEQQDVGTYKHNENRETVDLSREKVPGAKRGEKKRDRTTWASGKPQEIVANEEFVSAKALQRQGGAVYMKRMGAMIPRYKTVGNKKTNQEFFRSLEIARHVHAKMTDQTRSGTAQKTVGALVNVGSGCENTDSIGDGGSLSA